MPRFARVLIPIFLLLPLPAAAMQATTWDFRGSSGDWQATEGLQTYVTSNGLQIVATAEGAMFKEVTLPRGSAVLHVTGMTQVDTEMKFLWNQKGVDGAVELPFILHADGSSTDVDLTKYHQWNPRATTIGLAFPPGADVVIRTLELRRWNPIEKLEEAFLSAWTLDTFRAYSINFLWGPLIVTNTVARTELFNELPPFGISVNDVFYVIIALAGIAAIATALLQSTKRQKTLMFFFGATAACYVLYDLRMSAEILSYVRNDMRDYVLATHDDREFRLMQDFWTMVDRVRPTIEREKSVVFMTNNSFASYFRYALYPVETLNAEAPRSAPATWVIFGNDAVVGSDGLLMVDGNVVSKPGDIIDQPTPNSLLFRERP